MPRRDFLIAASAGAATAVRAVSSPGPKARVAITLDLEMSRNFPRREDTRWDYEKGNLDGPTKRYAVEVARRVKARGGRVHFFLVGRALEQEDVEWLRDLAAEGHPIGNHTYDHVRLTAKTIEEVQFRFQRSPWLARDLSPAELIRENIDLCSEAIKTRLGLASPHGFRSPGGFANGLADRPDLRSLLRDLGFHWVSTRYPAHPIGAPGRRPDDAVFEAIARLQGAAQPFRYPDGMIEIPMSPISDIGAFRTGQWPLEAFLEATRRSVEAVIRQGGVFDFLAHPSCLGVVDPECRTIDLICDLVDASRGDAGIVDLDAIAASLPPA